MQNSHQYISFSIHENIIRRLDYLIYHYQAKKSNIALLLQSKLLYLDTTNLFDSVDDVELICYLRYAYCANHYIHQLNCRHQAAIIVQRPLQDVEPYHQIKILVIITRLISRVENSLHIAEMRLPGLGLFLRS